MLIKRGSTWHCRFKFDRVLYQRSLHTRNRTEAVKLEAAFRASLVRGEFSIIDSRNAPTLAEFEGRLLPHLRANTAPRTFGFYCQNLAALKKFTPLATARLHKIDPSLIEKFVQFRLKSTYGAKRKKKLTPVTINHSLRTLRRVLHIAREWKLIREVPGIKLLPDEHEREAVLTDAEVDRMTAYIATAYPTSLMRHMLPFLVDTGLRISEACDLLTENVQFDDGLPVSIRVVKGKSKYSKREIPLTKRAAVALSACLQQSRCAHCFTSKGGRRKLTRHYPSEQFRTIRDALNLGPDVVLHSTRHTFCTRLGMAGANAFTIQKLAGHSSIVISQRYVHADREVKQEAIRLLDAQNVPKVVVVSDTIKTI
ncbi:MAG: tyrosine-type recombinase/integrase [Terriglobales bacterium]